MPLPGLLLRRKHFETLYGTQARRENLLFMSMIDPPFSFYYLRLETGGFFSLDNFSILSLWPNWYCANNWHVYFTLLQNKCSH